MLVGGWADITVLDYFVRVMLQKPNADRFHVLLPGLMWEICSWCHCRQAKSSKTASLVQIRPVTPTALECCISRKECLDTVWVIKKAAKAYSKDASMFRTWSLLCTSPKVQVLYHFTCPLVPVSHMLLVCPKWCFRICPEENSRLSGWLIATGPNV